MISRTRSKRVDLAKVLCSVCRTLEGKLGSDSGSVIRDVPSGLV